MKLNAVTEALKYVNDGDVIGLGSGTTVALFMEELSKSGKKVTCVPTSLDTLFRASKLGIPITTLNHVRVLEKTFDGADQVDERLRLIKGGGGALTREKVVAYSSKELVIMVDKTKCVKKLGLGFPVPLEFIFEALPLIQKRVDELFGATVVLRMGQGKLPPLISDNGLVLGDVHFKDGLEDPNYAEEELNKIPGVLENGLFTKHPNVTVLVGEEKGCKTLKRPWYPP